MGLNDLPPELMEFGLTPIITQGTIPRYFHPWTLVEGQKKDLITEKQLYIVLYLVFSALS